MQYLHIPVDFSKPTLENFDLVAHTLQQEPQLKTLLHCQVNFRAATFFFLYRMIYLKMPMEKAKHDLDSVWLPNPIWYRFIVDTLAHYDLSHECDSCDWGERAFD